jgi:uncharacterized protein (DUF433 family)
MVNRELPAIDLTQYIEQRYFGECPHVRGRRLPVWVVAYAVIDNRNIGLKELMYAYDLSEQEVLATLIAVIGTKLNFWKNPKMRSTNASMSKIGFYLDEMMSRNVLEQADHGRA